MQAIFGREIYRYYYCTVLLNQPAFESYRSSRGNVTTSRLLRFQIGLRVVSQKIFSDMVDSSSFSSQLCFVHVR